MNKTKKFRGAFFHSSWQYGIEHALSQIDEAYLDELSTSQWLPETKNIFRAFELPLENTRYVLIGESPYPGAKSATGFALMDGTVNVVYGQKQV